MPVAAGKCNSALSKENLFICLNSFENKSKCD